MPTSWDRLDALDAAAVWSAAERDRRRLVRAHLKVGQPVTAPVLRSVADGYARLTASELVAGHVYLAGRAAALHLSAETMAGELS